MTFYKKYVNGWTKNQKARRLDDKTVFFSLCFLFSPCELIYLGDDVKLTTTTSSSPGVGVSSLVGWSLATGSDVMLVEDGDSSGSLQMWFTSNTSSADTSALLWFAVSDRTWGAGLLWPVIGPGSGWLMMTRGTWGLLLALRLDLVELRMAMARAAGLAAGWLISSERAGPSEDSVRQFQLQSCVPAFWSSQSFSLLWSVSLHDLSRCESCERARHLGHVTMATPLKPHTQLWLKCC